LLIPLAAPSMVLVCGCSLSEIAGSNSVCYALRTRKVVSGARNLPTE